jgi:Zn-dependent M28 family amino/carboxypeptidase
MWRKFMIWILIIFAIVFVAYLMIFWWIRNPVGVSYKGEIPSEKVEVNVLQEHVNFLASLDPPRNIDHMTSLNKAADYIHQQWKDADFVVQEQTFMDRGQTFRNIITTLGPPQAPTIVIGAHYDVCGEQPGADDNASAVAGLLELSKRIKKHAPILKKHIEFVAYTLEEPPYFATELMGSAVHARSLKAKEIEVTAMISLEMLGYFDDQKNSQNYPISFMSLWYPNRGNFIAVVGDQSKAGRQITRKIRSGMERGGSLPVYSINAPVLVPGIDFSDHRNYWQEGYPALMITDTAFFRNANYHQITDTPDTLNYVKMAQVVEEVFHAVMELATQK